MKPPPGEQDSPTSPFQGEVEKLKPGISIAAARRALAQSFRAAKLDSPELDARLLSGHALGLDHNALAANAERVLSPDDVAALTALGMRRLAREPVAHILGRKEFWGLDLRVTRATLVPRPDTETVVETALAALPDRSLPLRIADFGTGSGAILLALLLELPNASGIGTDRSIEALAVARDNAARADFTARTQFVACDYGAALRAPFDLVVCNPPYIATGDIASLDADVRDYDPRLALDGGANGLDGYRAVVSDAVRILAPGGILVVELGAGQADSVGDLMRAAGLTTEPPAADLSGHFRALLGRLGMRG